MPLPTLKPTKASERAEFVIRYSGYFSGMDRENIETELKLHELYGTLIEVHDKKLGIIGIARWNWQGDIVYVLDVVIHPKFRGKSLLKLMLLRAKIAHPRMKGIMFKREKYTGRQRVYDVAKFLGVHNGR